MPTHPGKLLKPGRHDTDGADPGGPINLQMVFREQTSVSDNPVTLEFLGRQQQRLLDDFAVMRSDMTLMKDDITVLAAMAYRQDRATKAILERLDRIAERFGERLLRLEEPQ